MAAFCSSWTCPRIPSAVLFHPALPRDASLLCTWPEMQFNNNITFIPLFMFPLHETEIWFHKVCIYCFGAWTGQGRAETRTGWLDGVWARIVTSSTFFQGHLPKWRAVEGGRMVYGVWTNSEMGQAVIDRHQWKEDKGWEPMEKETSSQPEPVKETWMNEHIWSGNKFVNSFPLSRVDSFVGVERVAAKKERYRFLQKDNCSHPIYGLS